MTNPYDPPATDTPPTPTADKRLSFWRRFGTVMLVMVGLNIARLAFTWRAAFRRLRTWGLEDIE